MKNILRSKALEIRKNIDINFCSEKITEKLFSLDEYKRCKNILCYYPLKNEVSTFNCLLNTDKNWFLPRVNGEELEICPYDKDKIQKGSFSIIEPQTEKIESFDIIDMVIIPAVACDINGYRIGYGKGYYDRLLINMPKVVKVVLIPDACLFDNICPEKYDVKADIIITEKEVLRL